MDSTRWPCTQNRSNGNSEIAEPNENCSCCKRLAIKRARIHCSKCLVTACNLCGPYYFKQEVPVEPAAPARFFPQKLIQEQSYYIAWLEGEVERLSKEVAYYKRALYEQTLEQELEEDFHQLYNESEKKKGKEVISEDDTEITGALFKETISKLATDNAPIGTRIVKNMLYNMSIEFEIPEVKRFKVLN